MKKANWLMSLIFGLCALAQSQTLILLDKNEIFKSPEDGIVVMDRYTFGKYHYTAQKYDTLKTEVQRLDSSLQSKDSTQLKIVSGYEEVLKNKEEQINAYEKGFGEMESNLKTCIDNQIQQRIDYVKLEQKNKRVKKWRNVFLSTAITSIAIIVLLAK